MTATKSKTKPTQTIISLLILVILALIACTVVKTQYDYDMAKFGIITDMRKDIEEKLSAAEIPLVSKLAPEAFNTISAPESYNAENLYEKINGKAPLYTENGFKSLICQRFVSLDDENLIFEAYLFDMTGPRNAFAVYSVQKRADSTDIASDGFCYKTQNSVYFCTGRFYCEMVGYAQSPALVDAMQKAALDFITANSSDTQIEELELFPKQNFVSGSVKFYPSDAFGYNGFKEIFSCHYQIGDETITVFLSKKESAEQAKQMADGYFNFVIENGGKVKDTQEPLLKGKVIDFYDYTEIIFFAGNFTGGIHEAEDQAAAENIAKLLLENLNKLSSGDENGGK